MAKRARDAFASDSEVELDGDVLKSRSQSAEPVAHTPKYASVEPSSAASESSTMRCLLPPHKALTFASYEEYERHYQKDHTNRCLECSKNFPTAHFLDLHIAENHDPIIVSKREAGEKTFCCFVEGCDKVCSEWKKRRSHLVDKHGFPRNYDFLVVDHGIDGRKSMLRPGVDSDGHRKSSRERTRSGSSATETTASTEATSLSEANENHVSAKSGANGVERPAAGSQSKKEGTMDELADSMSALKMVPRSITFGKRKGRAGFSKN